MPQGVMWFEANSFAWKCNATIRTRPSPNRMQTNRIKSLAKLPTVNQILNCLTAIWIYDFRGNSNFFFFYFEINASIHLSWLSFIQRNGILSFGQHSVCFRTNELMLTIGIVFDSMTNFQLAQFPLRTAHRICRPQWSGNPFDILSHFDFHLNGTIKRNSVAFEILHSSGCLAQLPFKCKWLLVNIKLTLKLAF